MIGLAPLAFLVLMALVALSCSFIVGAVALTREEKGVALKLLDGEIRALLQDEAGNERAELTDEESGQFDVLKAKREALVGEIEALDTAAAKVESRRALLAKTKEPKAPVGFGAPVVTNMHDNSEDDMNRGYKTPRAFIMDILAARGGGRMSDLLKPLQVQATAGSDEHGQYSDPYGNFAVPPGFSPDLMKTTAEGDVLGGFVRNVPMTVPVLQLLARVDKNHTSSVSGGFRWSWGSEADTVASSRMEIEKITLTAHTAKGIAYATNELLSDSPLTFATLISDGFAEEYASFISEARLTGTGVGQLTGIRNSAPIISITKEDGQAAATVHINNILKMLARCWGSDNAVWVANRTLLPQLGVLTIDNGVSAVPIFSMDATQPIPMRLYGLPIIFTEHAPALGTAGDISLYNMREYLEGTLQNLQGQTSMHVRFLENEQTFRFTARKAGAPWWRSVLTPKNGDTLSPFVQLGARV